MEKFYEELMERFGDFHDQIRKAIEDLPDEALDWIPGADMNSLAVLLAHTAGAGRYLIGERVGGIPVNRDRKSEFSAVGIGKRELLARLDENMAIYLKVLSEMTLQDLHKPCTTRDGRVVGAGWMLLHALDHTGEHMGQILLTRQMWEQTKKK